MRNPTEGAANHFTKTWLDTGRYPLAFITYVAQAFEYLESRTDANGRAAIERKLASLPVLTEAQLQSVLTEIMVAAQFATQFAPLEIEPRTGVGDTRADFAFQFESQEIVVEVTRLSVKAFSDLTMIQDQLQERATLMCHKKRIHRQARIRYNYLPSAHDKDLILKRVSAIFAEAVATPRVSRTCDMGGQNAIEVDIDDLPIIYGDDDKSIAFDGDWQLRMQVDKELEGKIEFGGAFTLKHSVNTSAFVDLLRSSFEQKLRNTVRGKLGQRKRGRPFILVVDLSQVEALGTRPTEEATENLLTNQLMRHSGVSAICLFTRGEPWFRGKSRNRIFMSVDGRGQQDVQLSKGFVQFWAKGSEKVGGLESFKERPQPTSS